MVFFIIIDFFILVGLLIYRGYLQEKKRLTIMTLFYISLYVACSLIFLIALPIIWGIYFKIYLWYILVFVIIKSLLIIFFITEHSNHKFMNVLLIILAIEIGSIITHYVIYPFPNASEGWNELILSDDAEIREFCVTKYYKINKIEYLYNYLLEDEDENIRGEAFSKIWELGKKESIPYLDKYLSSLPDSKRAKRICNQFLNCGNNELSFSASSWANRHNYEIKTIWVNKTSDKIKEWK